MGQKVNPIGLRLGINRTWDSRWYAGKNEYGKLLHEDMQIRKELMEDLKQAAVSKIVASIITGRRPTRSDSQPPSGSQHIIEEALTRVARNASRELIPRVSAA